MNKLYTELEGFIVRHTNYNYVSEQLQQCFNHSLISSKPMCLAIIGEARTGKTEVTEEFIMRYPRTRESEGLKVPILDVVTPSKPTVNGLNELMLSAIGDERYWVGTQIRKTARLKKMMKAANTKMVVIDEFQHFVDQGSAKVIHHVADWLKNLVAECSISLVVVGLKEALYVLKQNQQLRGRFSAPVELPRFNWSQTEHQLEFLGVLSAFEKHINNDFDGLSLSSEELSFRVYCATGGLIGYIWKLLHRVCWNASTAGNRKITIDALNEAFAQSIGGDAFPNLFNLQEEFEVSPERIIKAMTIGVAETPVYESNRGESKIKGKSINQILAS